MTDPTEYRQESRKRWGSVAEGWRGRADWMRQSTMPVSAWMVDAIDPQPGHTLLELAAGPGDTGFLAAELIQPDGELICSDWVPEMLTAAQERAKELGIANVRFRQLDAESIDQPAASLDGVLCRWGYMLLADPDAALRETRRVLKPGARVALAAWAAREDNLWMTLPPQELVARGLVEPPDPDAPGPMAWAPEGAIAQRLDDAGFTEHTVEAVEFEMRYASPEDWWAATYAMSGTFERALAGLDDAAVDEVRAAVLQRAREFAQPDGSVVIPARTWVAAAGA